MILIVFGSWYIQDENTMIVRNPNRCISYIKHKKSDLLLGKDIDTPLNTINLLCEENRDVDICLKYTECIIPLYERRVSETGSLTRI